MSGYSQGEWEAKVAMVQEQAGRATRAELGRNYSLAFELYVRSGQQLVHLLSHPPPTPDAVAREKLKAMANKVMARAEKIKATHKHLAPVERDALSEEEQAAVLAASATINGRHFPVWTDAHRQAVSTSTASRLELSPEQVKREAQWRRASPAEGWARRLRGSEIVQDIVTDCSFVAALEAAAEHDHLFGTSLSTSALHPQDSLGRPQVSSTGRYTVRLHVNGVARCVEIDDHLPFYPSASGRLMGATSREGQTIWPALLEKAYLTLMGGYDFAGSTASIDAYALTGWWPEHIFLRHAGFQREKTWARFHAAWTQGRCFATLGTPSSKAADEVGLVPSHNYAILHVCERGSQRLVTLMNPWRNAAHPSIAFREQAKDVIEAMDALEVKEEVTFTVTWDDLCTHFDSLFLNWDPSGMEHRVDVHASWRNSMADGKAAGMEQPDPRFRLVVSASQAGQGGGEGEDEVWILLTRHITETPTTAKRRGAPAEGSDSQYIAVHVFEDDARAGEGEQSSVLPLGQARQVGAYVDGTHCLIRIKPGLARRSPGSASSAERSYTVVASRRGRRASSVRYTLSVLSRCSVVLSEVRTRLAFRDVVPGAWTGRSCGGNATLPTFMSNPQWTLSVPADAGEVQVSLTLECADRSVPVQLLLAYPGTARGGRVTHLTQGDLVLSSGMYHHGLALCSTTTRGAHTRLRPGTYTLVASTFEAATPAGFTLTIDTSRPVTLKPIPQEGAGMFHRRITSAWTSTSAKGSRANAAYFANPTWQIVVPPSGMAGLVARIKPNPDARAVRPYVHLALFDKHNELATSGAYTDLACGAAIDHPKLTPGNYTLVASTYQPDVHVAFTIDLYTAVRCDVTPV